jgi:nitrate/nitrite transporter NarK
VIALMVNLIVVVLDYKGRLFLEQSALQNQPPQVEQLQPPPSTKDEFSCTDIKSFNFAYWLVVTICICFYGSALSFTTFATSFLYEEYGMSNQEAARTSSLIYLSSMLLSPMIGYAVDLVGHRVHLLFFGSITLIPSFLLFGLTNVPPLPMISESL